jgi:ABC-type nitrate/sulfonate/bicarbonate transport system substrate-binding protein
MEEKKTKIRIGGVPEHFNVLWHYALEHNYFSDAGLDVEWTDYPSGSAPMAIDMNAGTVDVTIILTESIVASILNGNKSKIVGWYTKSSLIWGIHVAKDSSIQNPEDLAGKKYAVSRLGSGSHLMSLVDAENRNLSINPEQFIVVNNLPGAAQALPAGVADVFFWEKFTTKPWVDNGTFRRIGECPTPWPCFVIAASNSFLEKNPDAMELLLRVIYRTAQEFRLLPNATEIISKRYGLKVADVEEWYKALVWAETREIDPDDFVAIAERLRKLGVIESTEDARSVVYQKLS